MLSNRRWAGESVMPLKGRPVTMHLILGELRSNEELDLVKQKTAVAAALRRQGGE